MKYELELKQINERLFKRLERHLKEYGITLGDVIETLVYNSTIVERSQDERQTADSLIRDTVFSKSKLGLSGSDYTPFEKEQEGLELEDIFSPDYMEYQNHSLKGDTENFTDIDLRKLKAQGYIKQCNKPPVKNVLNAHKWYEVVKPFMCDCHYLHEGDLFQTNVIKDTRYIDTVYSFKNSLTEFTNINIKELTSKGYIRKCANPEFQNVDNKPTYEVLKPFKHFNKAYNTGYQFTVSKSNGTNYIDFTYEKETKKK